MDDTQYCKPVVHVIHRESRFKPLTSDDEKLYELYAKSIEKKVRETFPSIPADFKLKPERICRTQGCGTFFDFKIALPDGKFAKVSFHTGGLRISVPGAENSAPHEPNFNVDPTPTSTADE